MGDVEHIFVFNLKIKRKKHNKWAEFGEIIEFFQQGKSAMLQAMQQHSKMLWIEQTTRKFPEQIKALTYQ